MAQALTEKKAEALTGTGFLSKKFCFEKRDAFRLGYFNNSTKTGEVGKNFCEVSSDALESYKLLGNTTNKVSSIATITGKYKKYKVLNDVKKVLEGTGFRVESCMKARSGFITVNKTGEVFHFGGVMACGSVWLCPVCASRVTEKRKVELQEALNRTEYYPVLVTVTLAHNRSDLLAELLDTLNTSLRKLKSGRFWKSFAEKWGVVAHVSSLEITYSQERGFHPHKHMLLFLKSGTDIQELRQELTERYLYLIDKHGGYASKYHAIDVQGGAYHAGVYLSKWGVAAEITKSNLKTAKSADSYSMFELAELGTGEVWARQAFLEYAHATYGKRALSYSHGGRDVLGIGPDKSDAELAEVETEIITTITRKAWNYVLLVGAQGFILTVAEVGGKKAVDSFISYLLSTFGFT